MAEATSFLAEDVVFIPPLDKEGVVTSSDFNTLESEGIKIGTVLL